MKTIVIAAGYATRLYPLTENFPKPLLRIGESTILDRLLDDIDTIPEVTEHIVVTTHRFAGIFDEWAAARNGDHDRKGNGEASVIPSAASVIPSAASVIPSAAKESPKPVRIIDDGTSSNETRLGAVRDLILALETCGVDEDVLVAAGDNVLEFSLRGFVEEFRRKGTSMIMYYYESELRKLQRTGVIEIDGDRKVLQMQEKPEVPVSGWAVPPFYIYRREDIDLVRHSIENGCGADAPGNLARYLVGRTPIHAWPMPGARFDIGSLDTYAEAQRRYCHFERSREI